MIYKMETKKKRLWTERLVDETRRQFFRDYKILSQGGAEMDVLLTKSKCYGISNETWSGYIFSETTTTRSWKNMTSIAHPSS